MNRYNKLYSIKSLFIGALVLLLSQDVQAQDWTLSSDGLCCSDILSIVSTPDGTLFAGSKAGDIFRRRAAEDAWEKLYTSGVKEGGVAGLATDGNAQIFAALETGDILRSTDAGSTWEVVYNETDPDTRKKSIAVLSRDVILVGTNRSIFRSEDGGDTWTCGVSDGGVSDETCGSVSVLETAVGPNGTVYISLVLIDRPAPVPVIWRSRDDGVTWTEVFSGERVRALSANADGHVYAGTDSEIWISLDEGESWDSTDFPGGNTMSFAVNSAGTLFVSTYRDLRAQGEANVFRWAGPGQPWEDVFQISRYRGSLHSLTVLPNDHLYLSLSNRTRTFNRAKRGGSGILRSTDAGDTWQEANAGLNTPEVLSIDYDPRSSLVYTGTRGGLFRSSNGGETWENISNNINAQGRQFVVAVGADGTVYAGDDCTGGHQSQDQGVTWTSLSDLPFFPGSPCLYDHWIRWIDVDDAGTIYLEESNAYRSFDNGATWNLWSPDQSPPNNAPLYVEAPMFIEGPNQCVAGRRETDFDPAIACSENGGETWTRSSFGIPSTLVVSSMSLSPDGSIIMGANTGGANNGVYASIDRGLTWSQKSTGLGSNHIDVVHAAPDGSYLAGRVSRNGFEQFTTPFFFLSNDAGDTWDPVLSGLTNDQITAIESTPDGTILIGTMGGLFRGRTPTVIESTQPILTDAPVDFADTGVSIDFDLVAPLLETTDESLGLATVRRVESGPAGREGILEENVSIYRWIVRTSQDLDISPSTEIRFDDPTQSEAAQAASDIVVYQRSLVGTGAFEPLTTLYDEAAGQIVATDLNGFGEFVFASNSEPLPVELADFSGHHENGSVQLRWLTLSESENAGFRVERIISGDNTWGPIGFVESKSPQGRASQRVDYAFTDDALPFAARVIRYRLVQVDVDGATSVSHEIRVSISPDASLRLWKPSPNPASQFIRVQYALPKSGAVTMSLYNILGQRVRHRVVEQSSGRHEETLDIRQLASGIYFVRLSHESGTRTERVSLIR